VTIPLPDIAALFALTFARVGVLVMLLPGLGERMVPPRMRLAFAVLLTLILLPFTRTLLPPLGDPAATVTILISEIAAGLVLGLATRMIVAALQTAGTIISSEIGLSFATTVDPSVGGQDAAIGGFLNFSASP
jgi:flagellar biosynthetic protein FliR